MPGLRGLIETKSPAAVILIRLLAGGVFLAEGIKKFLFAVPRSGSATLRAHWHPRAHGSHKASSPFSRSLHGYPAARQIASNTRRAIRRSGTPGLPFAVFVRRRPWGQSGSR